MKQLVEAIVTKFAATSDLTTNISGGLWTDTVPAGTSRPYCRMSIIGNPINYGYGNGEIESIRIQFDIFSIGLTTVLGLQDKLHSAFDNVSLTMSNDKLIQPMRIDCRAIYDSRDENDDEVYRSISEYRFQVQKGF